MTSKKINYNTLDFDEQKAGLKTFLSGQDIFKDYDFEGSGLSVLLDILTYNTHYNSIYNNLSINEMFLDSARKRNSVVSLAKMLGYTPKSANCSVATVSVTVNTTGQGPETMILPANNMFTTSINGKTYSFYNRSSHTALGTNSYTFTNVDITEGVPLTYRFIVNTATKFVIPNINVDINTLSVKVLENQSSSTSTIFKRVDNLLDINASTPVYWVKEIDNQLYEIVFGTGIIGKALENGNVVILDYMVSSLDAPNNAKLFNGSALTFSSTDNIGFTISGIPLITTSSISAGGKNIEDVESIRFSAPKSYSAQHRSVTSEDYKALIYDNVPEAESVSVWGGEDEMPPIYGKVFVCIKPYNSVVLSTQQKIEILNTVLKSKTVVTVLPEIVDPEYINIAINTTVYYNELITTKTAHDIDTIVRDTINSYNDTELQRFDGVFKYSKLSRLIDESEPSIISNITTISLKKELIPKYNISALYHIHIINPIYYSGVPEDNVLSTGFYIYGSSEIHYLVDDGVGNMVLFYILGSSRVIRNSSIGNVDYANGIINITNLHITSIVGSSIEVTIKPSSNDVVTAYTQIAQISPSLLTTTVISDQSVNGNLRGGKNYVFTTSRS